MPTETKPDGHDERRVHIVTDAEGPGSPGGLGAVEGRAVPLGGEGLGLGEPMHGRDPYEAGAEVRPPSGAARGPSEAMAEGRFGQKERPRMGRALEEP